MNRSLSLPPTRRQRLLCLCLLWMLCMSGSAAWTSARPRCSITVGMWTSRRVRETWALHSEDDKKNSNAPAAASSSSQEQPEEEQEPKRTSFDEAGKGLIDEEDSKRMAEMGDFDSNPDYQATNIDKMREAIRKRTSEMGLEKSKVSQELLKEAALEAQRKRPQGASLDLSQIRGQVPEDMPTMFYNPEDEMSDEEKVQVDPIQTENWLVQARTELSSSKWPDLGAALKEVGLMVLVIALTSLIIIQWDGFLRGFYTDTLHLIPTKQEIQSRFTGLDLPEGWTKSLNEQDLANLPDQMRDSMPSGESGAGGGSGSESDGAGGTNLPDL